MKKILFTILCVGTFIATQAQEFNFGAKAGVNLASIGGDDTDDLDGRTSFHLGLTGTYMLSEQFALQGELLYSSVGAKFEENGDGFSGESVTKLDYLSIPLLGRFFVTEGFSLEAGPQISLLLSAKEEFDFSDSFEGEVISESGEEDVDEFINGLDLGFALGTTYELDMGVFLSARYVLGLSNINDFDDDDGDDFKNQNNVLQVSVGYKF
ncbi:PorT family protein [Dokdonia sinensis]|uniref:PorT family protein n=1 Tax=Dokdonia sinensis TaxID=2479847 RepID=A0A3M0FXJ4_9FLAO|nr:porin family protein [Dokdonia sinensis]RMB57394.1 PorT family protein [Dokdonia sinensis]